MSLRTQAKESFRVGFVLLILAIITCAECVLVTENAAFLQSQGKSHGAATALATCVALLIPIVASFRIRHDLWALVGKWGFVTALVSMQVWFASQTAIAPQLAQTTTKADRVLIAAYQSQLRQYDSQITEHQKRIDAYSDKYRSRKADLSGEQAKLLHARNIALSELQTVIGNAGDDPVGIQSVFRNTTIAATILYRLALEVGIIFLAMILRSQFAAMPELSRPHSLQHANATPSPAAPAIPQQIATQTPADAPQTARDFVQTLYPNARCTSEGRGRKGPFIIYGDETDKIFLGKGGNNLPDGAAWGNAALKIRRAA